MHKQTLQLLPSKIFELFAKSIRKTNSFLNKLKSPRVYIKGATFLQTKRYNLVGKALGCANLGAPPTSKLPISDPPLVLAWCDDDNLSPNQKKQQKKTPPKITKKKKSPKQQRKSNQIAPESKHKEEEDEGLLTVHWGGGEGERQHLDPHLRCPNFVCARAAPLRSYVVRSSSLDNNK